MGTFAATQNNNIEVNYAKALQLALTFYDASKCGSGVTGGFLEWRGDCHLCDMNVPLKPMASINSDGTNMSQKFINDNKKMFRYFDCSL